MTNDYSSWLVSVVGTSLTGPLSKSRWLISSSRQGAARCRSASRARDSCLAWRSDSVRPAVTVERRVSREWPRPTASGSARVPISNRFRSRQLPRLGAWPLSGVHCSRPQRTTGLAANHGERTVSERTASFSFLRHMDAPFNEGDSGVSRDDDAANAGGRCIRVAEYQIHIRGVATFPARSSLGRWPRWDPGSHAALQPSVSKRGAGTHGALIFEDVRARLRARSPAMAASWASRSTQ